MRRLEICLFLLLEQLRFPSVRFYSACGFHLAGKSMLYCYTITMELQQNIT